LLFRKKDIIFPDISKGGKMPKETLMNFLKDEAELLSREQKHKQSRLSKYIEKDSPFYKDYFSQSSIGIQEQVKEINNPTSCVAEIATQNLIDPNVYKKYILVQSDNRWLISNMFLRCAICKGEGCEHCEDGWLK
jgi:hypothetical protein